MSRPTRIMLALIAALALLGAGCTGNIVEHVKPQPGPADSGTLAFEPLPAAVYGNKVKNLILGEPLTNEELQTLLADPKSLKSLVDGWMAQPAWRQRMLLFFKQAFQQTQVTLVDYTDVFHYTQLKNGAFARYPLVRELEEMFPRTVLELMDEGRPFNDVVTTHRFMVTPPLLALITYADAAPEDDNLNKLTSKEWPVVAYPDAGFTAESDTPVDLSESLDAGSPNFLTFYDPGYVPPPAPAGVDAGSTDGGNPNCVEPYTASLRGAGLGDTLAWIFGGRIFRAGNSCGLFNGLFTADDWDAWRMVTFRVAKPGEHPTAFWDLTALRTANEIVVSSPRVGFMTTPAFQANWPTNTSNQARVTTNQTMIVALGLAFDDRGVTVPVQSSADDSQHAQPGTTCYSCHQTLDPMRDFFRQSYAYSDSARSVAPDPTIPNVGSFSALGSSPVKGHGVDDLAHAIAMHPRFAVAWAQKLCRFANSTSCAEDDPEFQRVVHAFQDSNFDFKVLFREMMSSPLVTFAQETKSSDDYGVGVSISRQASFCDALSARLGLKDICAIHGTHGVSTVPTMAQAIPGDGYARGQEAPLLPTDPNLFFTSATENICAVLAKKLVDSPLTNRFRSRKANEATADLVSTVMGVPDSDPRFAKLQAALLAHYQSALTEDAGTPITPTTAMMSTFVVACESPLSVGAGL